MPGVTQNSVHTGQTGAFIALPRTAGPAGNGHPGAHAQLKPAAQHRDDVPGSRDDGNDLHQPSTPEVRKCAYPGQDGGLMAARVVIPTLGDMETTLMDNQVPVDDGTIRGGNRNHVRRGSLFWTAVLAALGSAAIYLAPLLAVLHESILFGIVFVLLGIAQLDTVGTVVTKPTVRNLVHAGCAAGAVVMFWVVKSLGLVTPDPWQPVDTVIGFTDRIAAALATLAGILFAALAARGAQPRPSVRSRVLVGLGSTPLTLLVALAVAVGVLAATDGFTGAGFPTATVAPQHLPAGHRSTVEILPS